MDKVLYNFDKIQTAANDNIEFVLTSLGFEDLTFRDTYVQSTCHVHGGDNKTAFYYDLRSKTWKCFTRGCHNDLPYIGGLVKKVLSRDRGYEVSFKQAIEWLAGLLKISDFADPATDTQLEMARVVTRAKLQNRGKTPPTPKMPPFPISILKENYNLSSEFFLNQGFYQSVLAKFYVGTCLDARKPLYNRSYAPILSEDGQMVLGASGRTLLPMCPFCPLYHRPNQNCPKEDSRTKHYPKWLHFGFNSSENLYNIWNAKEYIGKHKTVVICESPKDVWWFDQHSVYNAVSVMGLNISQYHIKKIIEAGATKAIIALDRDQAGVDAFERVEQNLRNYFNVINLADLFSNGEDVADITKKNMEQVIVPFITNEYT